MTNPRLKTLAEWMAEQGLRAADLAETALLDRRVVEAIAHGRYTASPEQRQRICKALGLSPEQIMWGHFTQVDHMYGHGPQFGRSP